MIDRLVERLAAGFLALTMLAVLYGAADRFLIRGGAAWPEEAARHMLMWSALLGAGLCVKERSHFSLAPWLESGPFRGWAAVGAAASRVLIAATAAALIWHGLKVADIGRGQRSPGTGLPLAWVYLSLPVSAAYMLAASLRRR